MTPAARRLDEATDGALRRAIEAAPRFRGRKDALLTIPGPPGIAANRIVLAGLGKPDAVDAQQLQKLAHYLNSQQQLMMRLK